MNKYCMGVVVYNPTIAELKNIELYANTGLFGLIMIYDNSPKKIDYKFNHVICQYHFQNENSGLAKPYNKMLNDWFRLLIINHFFYNFTNTFIIIITSFTTTYN